MKVFVETDRLILREIVPSDEEGMFALDSDAEVHRYLGNQPITSREQAKDMIAFIRQQYDVHGIARWAMIHKETGSFMGWAGLKFVDYPVNNHKYFYDLGYRLRPQYWQQGYATEAAKALLAYAFDTLHLPEVYGMADVSNTASRRVLEKAGLKYLETFDYEGTPHVWLKATNRRKS